ncbi:hypothetical protein NYO67_7954 [Aspergillus flavus]|nr:hypothetical protein NYO67_7954 [Aspergillus flavus]
MKLSLILAACATLAAAAVTESTAFFAATENMSFPKDVFITSRNLWIIRGARVRGPDPGSMQEYLWPTCFPMFSLHIQCLRVFQQLLSEDNALWCPINLGDY